MRLQMHKVDDTEKRDVPAYLIFIVIDAYVIHVLNYYVVIPHLWNLNCRFQVNDRKVYFFFCNRAYFKN